MRVQLAVLILVALSGIARADDAADLCVQILGINANYCSSLGDRVSTYCASKNDNSCVQSTFQNIKDKSKEAVPNLYAVATIYQRISNLSQSEQNEAVNYMMAICGNSANCGANIASLIDEIMV